MEKLKNKIIIILIFIVKLNLSLITTKTYLKEIINITAMFTHYIFNLPIYFGHHVKYLVVINGFTYNTAINGFS